MVAAIKYAIVRPDPLKDPFLTKLVDLVDRRYIVSGIGERPVITHLRDFGLNGFTSGSVCVGPRGSTQILEACKRKDWETAAKIRERIPAAGRSPATPTRPSACCTRRCAWPASPTPARSCRCCPTSSRTGTSEVKKAATALLAADRALSV